MQKYSSFASIQSIALLDIKSQFICDIFVDFLKVKLVIIKLVLFVYIYCITFHIKTQDIVIHLSNNFNVTLLHVYVYKLPFGCSRTFYEGTVLFTHTYITAKCLLQSELLQSIVRGFVFFRGKRIGVFSK